jgi:hypothetical protein
VVLRSAARSDSTSKGKRRLPTGSMHRCILWSVFMRNVVIDTGNGNRPTLAGNPGRLLGAPQSLMADPCRHGHTRSQ